MHCIEAVESFMDTSNTSNILDYILSQEIPPEF